jgi:flagellar biosynthetic protein FliR
VIEIDLAKLQPLIAAVFFPFIRIGACVMVAPVFGANFVPARLRIVLAGALSLLVAPLLPAAALPSLLSADAIVITLQQLLIGVALGFSLQLVFDTLALGGQLLANGMGLGVAFNIDPLRGVTTPALGQLYVVLSTLIFLALNGHIALLQLLVDSFHTLPLTGSGFGAGMLRALVEWAASCSPGRCALRCPASPRCS